MIRYIKGILIGKEEGRIVVLAGGVGYEILLPEIVWQTFQTKPVDEEKEEVELYISYHQTAQQPKPLLVGFTNEIEREFFELLIKVKAIGPVKASRALTLPVPVIAAAIEERDATTVVKLKGIGNRAADMIISELHGKTGKYALLKEDGRPSPEAHDVNTQVLDVLVKQLGHSRAEAVKMVEAAIERKPDAVSPEEIFEEVYRGIKAS
jgi:Holliday junction DNA helicase RuvA